MNRWRLSRAIGTVAIASAVAAIFVGDLSSRWGNRVMEAAVLVLLGAIGLTLTRDRQSLVLGVAISAAAIYLAAVALFTVPRWITDVVGGALAAGYVWMWLARPFLRSLFDAYRSHDRPA